jgi:predicted negative regulator of RcsB-dependent stress response
MKNGNFNGPKGDNMFGIVLLAIILLIIFSCLFGWFCWKSRKTEGFVDERYFHYDNIGNLIPTDPPHVTRNVVQDSLMNGEEMNSYFGSVKKKTNP